MRSTLIRPITERPSLFLHSPTRNLIGSPYGSLSSHLITREEDYGLTTFRAWDIDRLGLSYPPAALFAHDRKDSSSCARCCAFWLKPGDYAFSLSLVTAFIRHSHVLTLLSNSSPFPLRHFGERTCLMACALAFARGYIVGGALQGGLAVPPHPPRSLLKKW